MTLAREHFGAIQPERLYSNQYLSALRNGNRKALNFQNVWSARLADHCGFHRGHQVIRKNLCSWWVGSGKAVARDFPGTVYPLEYEEFLIGFWSTCTRRVDLDC